MRVLVKKIKVDIANYKYNILYLILYIPCVWHYIIKYSIGSFFIWSF